MWPAALFDPLVSEALQLDTTEALQPETIRATGTPEAELADLLREHESHHGTLEKQGREVTTCLRDGDLEVVTRWRTRRVRPEPDRGAQVVGPLGDGEVRPSPGQHPADPDPLPDQGHRGVERAREAQSKTGPCERLRLIS